MDTIVNNQLTGISNELTGISSLIEKLCEVANLTSHGQDALQRQVKMLADAVEALHHRVTRLELSKEE